MTTRSKRPKIDPLAEPMLTQTLSLVDERVSEAIAHNGKEGDTLFNWADIRRLVDALKALRAPQSEAHSQ